MKVLIIHPEFENQGGVSGFFSAFKDKFNVDVKHFNIGKRIGEKGPLAAIFRFFNDYLLFAKWLRSGKYNIAHINPSLDFKSVIRDGIFILLSKYYKLKVVVFFHGWDKLFERKMSQKRLRLFQYSYGQADAFVVLATEFKNKLLEWNFKQLIFVETTAVNDNLIRHLDIQTTVNKRMNDNVFKVLFLARIVKEKGIYEVIEAVRILSNKYSCIELVIAGDGEELQRVKDYVITNNVSNIIFTGYITGVLKKKFFEESSVYCLPTYGEGCPVSILDAMAFGLPVITRPVGGIIDFFEQGKHGFLTESHEPSVFAHYLEKLYIDTRLYKDISLYNYQYAIDHFLASKVVRKLEKIYQEVLS